MCSESSSNHTGCSRIATCSWKFAWAKFARLRKGANAISALLVSLDSIRRCLAGSLWTLSEHDGKRGRGQASRVEALRSDHTSALLAALVPLHSLHCLAQKSDNKNRVYSRVLHFWTIPELFPDRKRVYNENTLQLALRDWDTAKKWVCYTVWSVALVAQLISMDPPPLLVVDISLLECLGYAVWDEERRSCRPRATD